MFRVLTRYQLERSIARDNVVTRCFHNITDAEKLYCSSFGMLEVTCVDSSVVVVERS
jgi:hypothetical protein